MTFLPSVLWSFDNHPPPRTPTFFFSRYTLFYWFFGFGYPYFCTFAFHRTFRLSKFCIFLIFFLFFRGLVSIPVRTFSLPRRTPVRFYRVYLMLCFSAFLRFRPTPKCSRIYVVRNATVPTSVDLPPVNIKYRVSTVQPVYCVSETNLNVDIPSVYTNEHHIESTLAPVINGVAHYNADVDSVEPCWSQTTVGVRGLIERKATVSTV